MRLNEAQEYHETLNPRLWTEDNKLRTEVSVAIKKIVTFFIEQCDLDIPVLDVYIVGSNASFNYSPTSDLDVHIITNYEDVDCNKEVIELLYNMLKTKFNQDYDFTIHGIPVEMYIQDVNSASISNGIYSLMNKEWIKFPVRIKEVKTEVEDKDLLNKWMNRANNILLSNSSDELNKFIDDIYLLRQQSLATDGEFGDGNLVFKEIRANGLLQQMKDKKKQLISRELTVEGKQKCYKK